MGVDNKKQSSLDETFRKVTVAITMDQSIDIACTTIQNNTHW